MQMLVLDAAQVAALSGDSGTGARLEPRPLADGSRWVLPPAVLDDPAHAARRDALAALPVAEVTAGDFPAALDDL